MFANKLADAIASTPIEGVTYLQFCPTKDVITVGRYVRRLRGLKTEFAIAEDHICNASETIDDFQTKQLYDCIIGALLSRKRIEIRCYADHDEIHWALIGPRVNRIALGASGVFIGNLLREIR